jgi:hypothetical protein
MIPISFTITTCGRLDLLKETIDSFFLSNDYVIDEFIMSDDSLSEDNYNFLKKEFGDIFKILKNEKKYGIFKSVDNLYKNVKNEFIFHCEDDWVFDKKNNFIEKSLDILTNHSDIHQVWIRHEFDNPHKPNPLINSTKNNTLYKNIEVWEKLWGGFSLNPGLRRKSDYLNFFPNGFSEFKDEIECSKYLISKKYKTVLLNETSCYHNGYNKRTNNFKH